MDTCSTFFVAIFAKDRTKTKQRIQAYSTQCMHECIRKQLTAKLFPLTVDIADDNSMTSRSVAAYFELSLSMNDKTPPYGNRKMTNNITNLTKSYNQ